MEMEGLTLYARFAGEDFGIDSASSPRTVCLRFFFIQVGLPMREVMKIRGIKAYKIRINSIQKRTPTKTCELTKKNRAGLGYWGLN